MATFGHGSTLLSIYAQNRGGQTLVGIPCYWAWERDTCRSTWRT